MQSLETTYHLLSQEVSRRWSPKVGNKSRKRKTRTMANKRPNEGGKENAQRGWERRCQVARCAERSTLRLEQVRGSSRRWWTSVPALGGRAWQGGGAGGDSARGGCWLSLRCSPWGPLQLRLSLCIPSASQVAVLSLPQSPRSSCFPLISSPVMTMSLPDEAGDHDGNLWLDPSRHHDEYWYHSYVLLFNWDPIGSNLYGEKRKKHTMKI